MTTGRINQICTECFIIILRPRSYTEAGQAENLLSVIVIVINLASVGADARSRYPISPNGDHKLAVATHRSAAAAA